MPRKPTKNPAVMRRIAANERNAHPGTCRCGADVLVGLDDDRCALTVRVDPVPVSAAGELLALARGRGTFRVRQHAGGVELYRRDVWAIDASPAQVADECATPTLHALLGVVVYAEHDCEDAR